MIILKTYQQHFQNYILKNNTDMMQYIASSKKLKNTERMRIYQNSYYARMIIAMKQDFPKLCDAIGEPAFESLVCDYIDAHPSQHFNLRTVGAQLAEFILSKDPEFVFYAELAREEYGLSFLHTARDY